MGRRWLDGRDGTGACWPPAVIITQQRTYSASCRPLPSD